MCMRLIILLLTAMLATSPLSAQQNQPSSSSSSDSSKAASSCRGSQPQTPPPAPSKASSAVSSGASPGQDEDSDLPVSLDRIRQALDQAPERPPLLGLSPGNMPSFHIEIHAPRGIQELMDSLKFNSGPTPPGGLYNYEQQQNLWSKQQHPEMQPYGAFGQGQMITILLENLLEKYVAARVVNGVSSARQTAAEEAAREEVQRALAEFWAYQAQQQAAEGQASPKP